MNNSPAEIIRQILIVANVGQFAMPPVGAGFVPLYVSLLPDPPEGTDEAGAVYDTQGIVSRRLLASGTNVLWHGFQLRVRTWDYSIGWQRATAVALALQTVRHTPVAIGPNSYIVDTVKQSSPVLSIGQDDKRRLSFVYNGMIGLI